MNPVVLGLLVFVPLVQVPLVLWLGRFFEIDEDYDPSTVGSVHPNQRGPQPTDQEDHRSVRRARPVKGEAGLCWQCGTVNDPSFSYCRDCLTALG